MKRKKQKQEQPIRAHYSRLLYNDDLDFCYQLLDEDKEVIAEIVYGKAAIDTLIARLLVTQEVVYGVRAPLAIH